MRSVENTQWWVGHNAARHSGTLVRPSFKIRWLHEQLQILKKSGFSYVSHCLSLSHSNGNDPQKCSCIKQSTNLDLLRGNVMISENAANWARIHEIPNDSGCIYCWQICSCVSYLRTDGITQSPGHTDAQISKYPTLIDGGMREHFLQIMSLLNSFLKTIPSFMKVNFTPPSSNCHSYTERKLWAFEIKDHGKLLLSEH